MPNNESLSKLGTTVRRGVDLLGYTFSQTFSVIRLNTEKTRHQVRDLFHSTSDQVLEKAEETRKAVKLRMAIMEIEHHLNRLYPQIGKLACDLAAQGHSALLDDESLKSKVELAQEYRHRLAELKDELEAHHQRLKREAG